MPEQTAKGIVYPVSNDLVKAQGVPSKLALDMFTLAQTADDAIGHQADAIYTRAVNSAYNNDAQVLQQATRDADQNISDLQAAVNVRLAQLENAAGFPGDTLEFTDDVVSNLVTGDTDTRQAVDALYQQQFNPTVKTLTYYVATNGSDNNDGRTADRPRRTVQNIINETRDEFTGLGVEVVINLAAGTYTENVRFTEPSDVRRKYRIRGPIVPHPQVPTAVFSRGLGGGPSGIVAYDPNLDLTLESIKFHGYNSNSSAGGLVISNAKVSTVNVHAESCYWGIISLNGDLDVKGGIFEGNGWVHNSTQNAGAGIRSLMLNRHSIGQPGAGATTANGPIFRNNYYGMLAQESAVGHVDYSVFEDNEYGLIVQVNSRANATGSVFRRNTIGVMVANGSNVLLSAADAFPTDPANANHVNVMRGSSSTVLLSTHDAYVKGVNIGRAVESRRVLSLISPGTVSNSSRYVIEEVLSAGWWSDSAIGNSPPRKLILKMSGRVTSNNDTKIIRPMVGWTSENAYVDHSIPTSHTGDFTLETSWLFHTSGQQQVVSELKIDGRSPQVTSTQGQADTFGEALLRVSVSALNDTVRFDTAEIYVEG